MKRTSKRTGGSRRRSRARPAVADVLRPFADVASRTGARWFLLGAQAVAAHGVPRLSADIDITVMEPVDVEKLLAELRSAGFVPAVADAAAFLRRSRVVPLTHRPTGWPVDLVLGGSGPEEVFVSRAQLRRIEGVAVPVMTAEDLVAVKLLAGREKDLEDVRLLVEAGAVDDRRARAAIALLEEALDQSDLLPAYLSALADVGRRARR